MRRRSRADEEAEAARALGAAERAAERDGLRDARVAAELLHVPAGDETAEAVPDEVDATVRAGCARRGARGCARCARCPAPGACVKLATFAPVSCDEMTPHRTEDAGAREEAVHEDDDVVVRRDLRGHDRGEVARHERDLAQRRDRLGHARAERRRRRS